MDLHHINPRDITPITEGAVNRLFWAINHYVSTGTHIGEGVATRDGDNWTFIIPVAIGSKQDQADMATFRSRLDSITVPATIGYMGELGESECWILSVADSDLHSLTEALIEAPGSLGWGSGKAVIDSFVWKH